MQRRQALKILGTAGTALATLNGEALATLGDESPKKLAFPFRKKLGWFGEVRSNKDFSVSPKAHYGTAPNNPDLTTIIPGFNLKWEDGPTEFVSAKSIIDFRKGWTEEIVLDNPGWRNLEARGLQIRWHLYPEPHHIFRLHVSNDNKQLLIQSWEKDCEVTVDNSKRFKVVDIKSPKCRMTLFPPYLSERYWEYSVGNILMTVDSLPMTLNWVTLAASTELEKNPKSNDRQISIPLSQKDFQRS